MLLIKANKCERDMKQILFLINYFHIYEKWEVNGKTPIWYHKKHLSLSWDGRVIRMKQKRNRNGNDGLKNKWH